MMFCRAAGQRFVPLAHKTLSPLSKNAVPTRQMSFGLPASGTNIAFMVLGGGSLTAALIYAYKTINSDSVRYNDRIAQIEARSKSGEEAMVAFTAAALETAASELSSPAEASSIDPVSHVLVAEPTNATAGIPVAAMAVEVEEVAETPAAVETVTADAEEPDKDAESAAPVAGTTVETSSD